MPIATAVLPRPCPTVALLAISDSPKMNGNFRGPPPGAYGAISESIHEAPTKQRHHQRVMSASSNYRSISVAGGAGNSGADSKLPYHGSDSFRSAGVGAGSGGETLPLLDPRARGNGATDWAAGFGGPGGAEGRHDAGDKKSQLSHSSWMPRVFK